MILPYRLNEKVLYFINVILYPKDIKMRQHQDMKELEVYF
jgi:hypothetical protein